MEMDSTLIKMIRLIQNVTPWFKYAATFRWNRYVSRGMTARKVPILDRYAESSVGCAQERQQTLHRRWCLLFQPRFLQPL